MRGGRAGIAPALAWFGLPALLGASVMLSLALGAAGLGFRQVVAALTGTGADQTARAIVLGVRLPRTVMALLCGLALSASGTVFQAMLRNPLADPYLLGVSSGGALGAVLAMVLPGAASHAWLVPMAALAGAAMAAWAVYVLGSEDGGLPPHTLILAGVVISAFCSSLVLFLNVLMEARQLQGAMFWVMGGFSSSRASYLAPVAVVVAAGFGAALARGARMNLITQGEETAASLGLEVEREKKSLFLAAAVMTGAVVSVSGLIGFVGLVVPHAARSLVGPDHRRMLPAAALLGGAFLVLSDVAARSVLAPAELPVGVVTSLAGAPFFLWLLRRQGHAWRGR